MRTTAKRRGPGRITTGNSIVATLTLEKTGKIRGQLAPQRRPLSCDYTLCGGFHAGERGGGADELTTRRRRRYVL